MRGTSVALRPTLAFGWVIAACMSSSVAWAQLPSGQFLASGIKAVPTADLPFTTGTAWDPDGPGGVEELLVVAGPFTRIGNTSMSRVGAFDGHTWSPLGLGAGALPSVPEQLVIVAGELIARGAFVFGGSEPVPFARWDGQSWVAHDIPPLPSSPVEVATVQGVLIACGGWGVRALMNGAWVSISSDPVVEIVGAGTYVYWQSPALGIFRWAPGNSSPVQYVDATCYFCCPIGNFDAWGSTLWTVQSHDIGGGSNHMSFNIYIAPGSRIQLSNWTYAWYGCSTYPEFIVAPGNQVVLAGVRWRGQVVQVGGVHVPMRPTAEGYEPLGQGLASTSTYISHAPSVSELDALGDGSLLIAGQFSRASRRNYGLFAQNDLFLFPNVSPPFYLTPTGHGHARVAGNDIVRVSRSESVHVGGQTWISFQADRIARLHNGTWTILGGERSYTPSAYNSIKIASWQDMILSYGQVGYRNSAGEYMGMRHQLDRWDEASAEWVPFESDPAARLLSSSVLDQAIEHEGQLFIVGSIVLPTGQVVRSARWTPSGWASISVINDLQVSGPLVSQPEGLFAYARQPSPLAGRAFVRFQPLTLGGVWAATTSLWSSPVNDALDFAYYNGDFLRITRESTFINGTPVPSGLLRLRHGTWHAVPLPALDGFISSQISNERVAFKSVEVIGQDVWLAGRFTGLAGQDSAALVRWRDGPTCNDLDFNNDGMTQDPTDLEAFLSVYSGAACVPATSTCDSLDFNNDGIEQDPTDIEAFFSVYSGGPCV